MSDAVDKRDVTVDLPDEVLCHVFSFLSLKDKLQSEAVNHKFQRCILNELKAKPQPLELDLFNKKLNGYSMQKKEEEPIFDAHWVLRCTAGIRFFDALQALAKKAQFSGISVRFQLTGMVGLTSHVKELDRILSLLMSESQCLTKVTSFECDSVCSQDLLENFLDKCGKLSAISYNFYICSSRINQMGICSFPLDLCQLFKNRGLTQLELKLVGYHQEGLVHMFQGMKPNTLRNLHLEFYFDMPGLNMAQLVRALGPNASVLEELHLRFTYVHVPFADLFESLAQLPALRKCDIEFDRDRESENQFVATMTALFLASDINITLTCGDYTFFNNLRGCQIVNAIRQIQSLYPGLVVDFVRSTKEMILSLGNASLKKKFSRFIQHCGAEDCIQCQSFYPSLLDFLRAKRVASFEFVEAQYLPNCFLDRCKIDQCLDDLKIVMSHCHWKPVSVKMNQDQQSVTINFDSFTVEHILNSMTISCGRCLTDGCMKCIN